MGLWGNRKQNADPLVNARLDEATQSRGGIVRPSTPQNPAAADALVEQLLKFREKLEEAGGSANLLAVRYILDNANYDPMLENAKELSKTKGFGWASNIVAKLGVLNKLADDTLIYCTSKKMLSGEEYTTGRFYRESSVILSDIIGILKTKQIWKD
jgi:hypothetical protein